MAVRHMASGKYLAVETSSGPFAQGPSGLSEDWFLAFLVDEVSQGSRIRGTDESCSKNEGSEFTDRGWEVAKSEAAMSFYITTADLTETACLPLTDVNLRIEHRYVDATSGEKRTIFLHNSEEPKPKPSDSSSSSSSSAASSSSSRGR